MQCLRLHCGTAEVDFPTTNNNVFLCSRDETSLFSKMGKVNA